MEIKFTSWVIDWVRRDPERVIFRAPRQGGQDANLAASTCLRPFLKSTATVLASIRLAAMVSAPVGTALV
jgi:hypothetical protein